MHEMDVLKHCGRWSRSLAVVAALLTSSPTGAQQETDDDTSRPMPKPRFAVVDGDTVKFAKQIVRLFGIDAPEKSQSCDEGMWFPGPLATRALVDFIRGRAVVCYQVDYDKRNNRAVARCYAGDDDLQAMMVNAGWAWAFTQFSDRYVPEEKAAIAQKAGVHGHRCVPPWEWRATQRAQQATGKKPL